jgi:uncharacterized metal-binding protein
MDVRRTILRTEEHFDKILVGESSRLYRLSFFLFVASFVLFVVFLKKLAAYVDAQPLITRVASVLRLIKLAIILVGVAIAVWLLTGANMGEFCAIPMFFIAIVAGYKFFTLIRDLNPVLMQKL